jgi:hypothetical protein
VGYRFGPSSVVLFVSIPVFLACSGLPIPGASPTDPIGEGGDEVEEGEGEVAEGEPAPEPDSEPATPESLFAALDPSEAAPYDKQKLDCPTGAMVIRNPSGGRMRVYCATGSGVRTGPYTEWKGGTLAAAGTNVDGKLSGRFTRWQKGPDGLRKIGEETYAAGELDGDFATWDVEGNLLVRGVYVAGKKSGRFLESSVSGSEVTFGGACYSSDEELWRTSDAAEFVGKECSSSDES